MRVAHLLRKCDPDQWGGTEMALQRLLDGLRESQVEPVVYCPRVDRAGVGVDPLLAAGHRVERFRAFVPVLGLSRERKRQLVSVGGNLMSFDLLAALRREPGLGVIHAHTLGRLGGIGLTVAKQRRLPFIVTIHGGALDLPQRLRDTLDFTQRMGWEWGKLFGVIFQARKLFTDAQAILTCNEREAALLREQHPDKRIVVQPHAVPVEVYARDCREVARVAFPAIAGREVLLCAGRIDPVKNPGWLVEQMPGVLERHPRALLVLAGPCTDEAYGARLRARIQELGLEPWVLLTGGLPPDDPRLIGLLQEARLLVLASVSETFGLVILEAWAAGTPVLCSATSGARALVRHEENGWLFELDCPPTFHQPLDHALRHPEEARAMTAAGRDYVAREHSVGVLAARMRSLYEEVIEECRAA